MADRDLSLGVIFTGQVDSTFLAAVRALKDNITNIANVQAKASKAAKDSAKATKEAGTETEIYSKKIGNAANGIHRLVQAMKVTASYALMGKALYTIASAAKAAVTEIVQYDQALKNLEAITGANQVQVMAMGEEMQKVAATTKFSTREVADAMVTLGQAGFTAEESVAGIQSVADLATGTLTDMGTVSDLVTTSIRAFGLSASESSRVADVMASAVNRSKLTVDKLRVAFNYVGPVAHKSGLSLEETAAAMGLLANAGHRASTIGTGLRQMLARLIAPTDRIRAAFVAAGADLSKLDPRFNSLATVIDELRKVVPDAQRAFQLFGLRAASAVTSLVKAGSEGFRKMQDEMYNVGAAGRMAGTQMEGLAVKAKNLMDRLGLLAISIGEGGVAGVISLFLDTMREVVILLTAAIKNPFGQFITTIVVLTGVVGVLVVAIRALNLALGSLILKESISALTRYKGILGGITLAFTYLSKAVSWTWNLLKANPFFLVLGGLVTVGVAIKQAIDYYEGLSKALEKNILDTNKQIGSLEEYKKKLSEMDQGSKEYQATMQRLLNDHKELAPAIDETTWSFKDQGKALDNAIKDQHLKMVTDLGKLYVQLGKDIEFARIKAGLFPKTIEWLREGVGELADLKPQWENVTWLIPDVELPKLKEAWNNVLQVYKNMIGEIVGEIKNYSDEHKLVVNEIEATNIKRQQVLRSFAETISDFGIGYTSSVDQINKALQMSFNLTEDEAEDLSKALKNYYNQIVVNTLETENVLLQLTDAWVDIYHRTDEAGKKHVRDLWARYSDEVNVLQKTVEAYEEATQDELGAQNLLNDGMKDLKEKYKRLVEERVGFEVSLEEKTSSYILLEIDKRIESINRKYDKLLGEEQLRYEKQKENFSDYLGSREELEKRHQENVNKIQSDRAGVLIKEEQARISVLKQRFQEEIEAIEGFHRSVLEVAEKTYGAELTALEASLSNQLRALEDGSKDESQILTDKADIYVDHYSRLGDLQSKHLDKMIELVKKNAKQREYFINMEGGDAEKQREKVRKSQEQLHSDLKAIYEKRLKDYQTTIDALISEEKRLTDAVKKAEEDRRRIKMDSEDILRELSYKGLEDEEKLQKQLIDADEMYFKARTELAEGNLENSKEWAKKAQSLYASVARESEKDSHIEQRAIEGIKDATDKLLESTDMLETNATKSLVSVRSKLDEVSESAEAFGKKVIEASGYKMDVNVDQMMLMFEQAYQSIKQLQGGVEDLNKKEVDIDMSPSIKKAEVAKAKIDGVAKVLDEISGKTVTYTVEQNVIQKTEGGEVQEGDVLDKRVTVEKRIDFTADDGKGVGKLDEVLSRVKDTMISIATEVEGGLADLSKSTNEYLGINTTALDDLTSALKRLGIDLTGDMDIIAKAISTVTGNTVDDVKGVAKAVKDYNEDMSASFHANETAVLEMEGFFKKYYDQVSEQSKRAIEILHGEFLKERDILEKKSALYGLEWDDKINAITEFKAKSIELSLKYLSEVETIASKELDVHIRTAEEIKRVQEATARAIIDQKKEVTKVVEEQAGKEIEKQKAVEAIRREAIEAQTKETLAREEDRINKTTDLEEEKVRVIKVSLDRVSSLEEAQAALSINTYQKTNSIILQSLKDNLEARLESLKNSKDTEAEIISSKAEIYADHYLRLDQLNTAHLDATVAKMKEAYAAGVDVILGQEGTTAEKNKKILELETLLEENLRSIYQERANDYKKVLDQLIEQERSTVDEIAKVEEQKRLLVTENIKMLGNIEKEAAAQGIGINDIKLSHAREYYIAKAALADGDLAKAKEHAENVKNLYHNEAEAAEAGTQEQISSLRKLYEANNLLSDIISGVGERVIQDFDEIERKISYVVGSIRLFNDEMASAGYNEIQIDVSSAEKNLTEIHSKLSTILERLRELVKEGKVDIDTTVAQRNLQLAIEKVNLLINKLGSIERDIQINVRTSVIQDPKLKEATEDKTINYDMTMTMSPPVPFTVGIKKMKSMIKDTSATFNSEFSRIEAGAAIGAEFKNYIATAKEGHQEVLSSLENRLKDEENLLNDFISDEGLRLRARSLLYTDYYSKMFQENSKHLDELLTADQSSYLERLGEKDKFLAQQIASNMKAITADEDVRRAEAKVWRGRIEDHAKVVNQMVTDEEMLLQWIKDNGELKAKLAEDLDKNIIKVENELTKNVEVQNARRMEAEEASAKMRVDIRNKDWEFAIDYGKQSIQIWTDIARAAEKGSDLERKALDELDSVRKDLILSLEKMEGSSSDSLDTIRNSINGALDELTGMKSVYDELSSGLEVDIQTGKAKSSLDKLKDLMKGVFDFWSDGTKSLEDLGDLEQGFGFKEPVQTLASTPMLRTFTEGSQSYQFSEMMKDVMDSIKSQTYVQKTDDGFSVSPPDVNMTVTYQKQDEMVRLLQALVNIESKKPAIQGGDININGNQLDARKIAFEIRDLIRMGAVPALS